MYSRILKKKANQGKTYVWASFFFFFFFFLPLNSTLLHISFPGRQMTKARNFNFFFIGKLKKNFLFTGIRPIYYWYERMGKYSPKTYKTFSLTLLHRTPISQIVSRVPKPSAEQRQSVKKRFFPKITARLVFKIKSSFFSPFLVNGYILSCKCQKCKKIILSYIYMSSYVIAKMEFFIYLCI